MAAKPADRWARSKNFFDMLVDMESDMTICTGFRKVSWLTIDHSTTIQSHHERIEVSWCEIP